MERHSDCSELHTDHFRYFSRAKCTGEQMKETAAQYLGSGDCHNVRLKEKLHAVP